MRIFCNMKTPNMKKSPLSVKTTKSIRTKLLSLTFLACVLCSANNVGAQNAYPGTYSGSMPGTPTHPEFFIGEISLGGSWYYLQFSNGTPFGYYAYLPDESQLFIYHIDLGFEHVFDANDANHGIYLYDFASGSYLLHQPEHVPLSLRLQPKRVALLPSGCPQSGPLQSQSEMVLQLRDRPVDKPVEN